MEHYLLDLMNNWKILLRTQEIKLTLFGPHSSLFIHFPFCPQKLGVYNVSKTALLALTKTLAGELAPKNIRVNGLVPGIIETPFSKVVRSKSSHSYPTEQQHDVCLKALSHRPRIPDLALLTLSRILWPKSLRSTADEDSVLCQEPSHSVFQQPLDTQCARCTAHGIHLQKHH